MSPAKFSITMRILISVLEASVAIGKTRAEKKKRHLEVRGRSRNQEIRCRILIGVYGTRGYHASSGIIHRLCNELPETSSSLQGDAGSSKLGSCFYAREIK